MRPALLFAAIGPNPASISEAIYALYRQRGLCVVEAHLVSLERGHHWLADELLREGGIVAELAAVLPGALPERDGSIHERLATLAAAGAECVTTANDGHPIAIADDTTETAAAAYRTAIWEHARACLQRAGDARPVIFLLAGGRLRTMTAYATTVYQLLARAGDELYDVRVSDRRAEGGSGFFFPEQAQRHILTEHGLLDARVVEVSLVPVEVPRLGGLLEPAQLSSYASALAASRHAISAASPPRLFIDFVAGEARVNDERLPFTAAQLVWYGLLAAKRVADERALARTAADADAATDAATESAPFADADAPFAGAVPSDAIELITTLLAPLASQPWVQKIRDYNLRLALGLGPFEGSKSATELDAERLNKLRADTNKAIARWLDETVRPAWSAHLVPHKHKHAGASHQRLALSPHHIELRWPPA